MLAGDRALEAGDNSVIDELLDEFLNEEAETDPGLTAACSSTDFFPATGVDSFNDFLFDGVGTFLTEDCTPRSSVPDNYSSMIAAECRASLKANFSGDPFDLSIKPDAIGGELDVPNEDLQWVSSIFDEASFFTGENIQKTSAISAGVDENSDSMSQAAESEVSHPELGIRKPGSKRHNDDSPISTLDWELGVRYEDSKATNIMTTLKKRKAACGPAAAASEGRRCLHCQTDKTPQWRTGPEGPKTLCNACGMRFKSGRLVPEYRPASSPTFVGSHHSNSHRKVLELRRQKSILDQEQEQEQKQKQRRQLLGTCSLASVFGLPPAMRPLDALFHGLGSRRQFHSPEEFN